MKPEFVEAFLRSLKGTRFHLSASKFFEANTFADESEAVDACLLALWTEFSRAEVGNAASLFIEYDRTSKFQTNRKVEKGTPAWPNADQDS